MKFLCHGLFLIFVVLIAIQGFALTPEQIVQLKKAGVTDDTIQIMVQQEQQGVREVRNEKENISIQYSTGRSPLSTMKRNSEEEKIDRAWRLLENIIIDTRQQEEN